MDAGGDVVAVVIRWIPSRLSKHLSLVLVDTMKAPTTVRIVKTFPDSFSPLFVFTGVTHDAES